MFDERPVLVLGASGQVGRCLLRRLAASNRSVIAVCRRPMPELAPKADWLAADLERPLSLGDRRPAVAIHASGAWLLPPQLPMLRAIGVRRLICFSSTSILAKAGSPRARERAVARLLEEAETSVAAGGIDWTILRPALVYGLGLDQNVSAAARFIRRWRVFPLAGPGKGLRQPVHADDLAAAALACLEERRTIGQRYALGGGETLSFRAMIARIFRTLEVAPRFIRLPLLARLPGKIGAVAARMEQDLAFDDGALWRLLELGPRRFLADGRKDLNLQT